MYPAHRSVYRSLVWQQLRQLSLRRTRKINFVTGQSHISCFGANPISGAKALSCIYMGWLSEAFCRFPAGVSQERILWQCINRLCIVCPSRVIKDCQIRQYKRKTLILQRFAFWGVISAGQGLFLFPVKIKVFQRWWFHLQATLKSLNIYIRGIKYPRLQKQTGMNELCFTVPPELPRYGYC